MSAPVCGCEHGLDCTKTTVCVVDAALEDQAFEHERLSEIRLGIINSLELDRNRKDAQIAVYLQALSSESRAGRAEWAQRIVVQADLKAQQVVQSSDLYTAQLS